MIPIFAFMKAYWKPVLGIAFLLSAFFGGFHYGSKLTQADWDKEKLAQQQAVLVESEKQAKTIHDLGVQHDADQKAIDDLHAANSTLRLRLPKCNCGKTANAGSGGQAAAGKESLPDSAQKVLDGYTKGVGQLMYEADSVVNDCRIMQDYLKSLR